MKQSTSRKNRDATAFLYLRLSRDDNLEGESYSIGNQKKLLTKAAKDMGYTNLVIFTDDGVSGVTMNRPGFNEMMAELDKGRASAVFVKDDCVIIELNAESPIKCGFCAISSIF